MFTSSSSRPGLTSSPDRRACHIELRATEKTYMASVSWTYPQDQLMALRRQNASAEAAIPLDTGLDVGRLRFGYSIEGYNPPWRPLHVFDDGRKSTSNFRTALPERPCRPVPAHSPVPPGASLPSSPAERFRPMLGGGGPAGGSSGPIAARVGRRTGPAIERLSL
jgi:hypothetical protein